MVESDHELLGSFAREGDEDAFRELLDRHLGMAYRVALRMLKDSQRAEEAAHNAFILLARKALSLGKKQSLAGWIYQTTLHEALHMSRSETRRRTREEAAATMQLIANEGAPNLMLEELDAALMLLRSKDRNVLVLRFLEDRSLSEVGVELEMSEDAARMRVNRSLEKLRLLLEKRGLAASSGMLATVLTEQAQALVPAGLKEAIVSTAVLNVGNVAGTAATAQAFAWLNVKSATAILGSAFVVGTGIYLYLWDPIEDLATAPPLSPVAPALDSRNANTRPGEPVAFAGNDVSGSVAGETVPTAEARRLLDEALALIRQQRFEDGRALLDRALELSPRYPEAFVARGGAFEGMGQLETAAAELSRAIELRPGYTEAWFQRGRIAEQQERYDAAIRDCSEAIRLDPKYWPGYRGRAQAHFSKRDFQPSLRDVNSAIELNPESAEAFSLRAGVYYVYGQAEKAIADRERALELEPENAQRHYLLGRLLYQLERYDAALPLFNRALELDPTHHHAAHRRANVHFIARRWEMAVDHYSEFLRLVPQNHHFTWMRGMAYFQLGKDGEALTDLNRAIRLAPSESQFYVDRGKLYLRMKQNQEALADFNEAVDLDPENSDALFQRGEASRLLGQYHTAIEDFSRVIALEKTNTYAWEHRGSTRYDKKDYEAALRDFKRAFELNPESDYAAMMAGACALRMGDPDLAKTFFSKALAINPDNNYARQQLDKLTSNPESAE